MKISNIENIKFYKYIKFYKILEINNVNIEIENDLLNIVEDVFIEGEALPS